LFKGRLGIEAQSPLRKEARNKEELKDRKGSNDATSKVLFAPGGKKGWRKGSRGKRKGGGGGRGGKRPLNKLAKTGGGR